MAIGRGLFLWSGADADIFRKKTCSSKRVGKAEKSLCGRCLQVYLRSSKPPVMQSWACPDISNCPRKLPSLCGLKSGPSIGQDPDMCGGEIVRCLQAAISRPFTQRESIGAGDPTTNKPNFHLRPSHFRQKRVSPILEAQNRPVDPRLDAEKSRHVSPYARHRAQR